MVHTQATELWCKTWSLFDHCRSCPGYVGTCKSSDLPWCGNETTTRDALKAESLMPRSIYINDVQLCFQKKFSIEITADELAYFLPKFISWIPCEAVFLQKCTQNVSPLVYTTCCSPIYPQPRPYHENRIRILWHALHYVQVQQASNSSCNMHVFVACGRPYHLPDRVRWGIPSQRASFKVLVIDRSLSLIDTVEREEFIASQCN